MHQSQIRIASFFFLVLSFLFGRRFDAERVDLCLWLVHHDTLFMILDLFEAHPQLLVHPVLLDLHHALDQLVLHIFSRVENIIFGLGAEQDLNVNFIRVYRGSQLHRVLCLDVSLAHLSDISFCHDLFLLQFTCLIRVETRWQLVDVLVVLLELSVRLSTFSLLSWIAVVPDKSV